MKLTENDVFTWGGEYYNGNNDVVIVDGHVNDEENIKLRQQILNDYEKARKWDTLTEQVNLTPDKQIQALEDHADIMQTLYFEGESKQNRKLRELIEKRVEEIEPYTDISLAERKDVTIYNELQKLLEESKK